MALPDDGDDEVGSRVHDDVMGLNMRQVDGWDVVDAEEKVPHPHPRPVSDAVLWHLSNDFFEFFIMEKYL